MKKLLIVVFGVLMCANVYAAGLEVKPSVSAKMYDGADQAIGQGVDVYVTNALPNRNLSIVTGLESVSTEVDSFGEGLDVDIINTKLGLAYDLPVGNLLMVKPYATLDFAFVNGEDTKSKNEVGKTIGVNVEAPISDRTSLFGGLGYQWMETNANGEDLNLDNMILKGGLSIAF